MTRRASLTLPPAVRRAIAAHAAAECPLECCGFLVGRPGHVAFAVPSPNMARSTVRYRIDARAHIDLRRVLRPFVPSLSIIGVYHSHPAGPPEPSPSDIADAHYPDWVHVIVGLSGRTPRLAAFRIVGGRATRVRLD